jgi:lysophospholipase L1-like esterase
MQRRCFLIGLMAVLVLAGCDQPRPQRVVIIGDSTAAAYGPFRRVTGWGEALTFMLRDRALIVNEAVPGASTKSFAEQYWEAARSKLRPGDILLIQFGHNDALPDAMHHTEPEGRYRTQLADYVKAARRAGARPVLLTSIPAYDFRDGQVIDIHGRYLTSAREVARATGVPLIDLNRMAVAEMAALGPERSRAWFMLTYDDVDTIHLTRTGATAMAAMVVREMERIGVLGPGVSPR